MSDRPRYTVRAAEDWLAFGDAQAVDCRAVAEAFGLRAAGDAGAVLSLIDLGARFAPVVREHAYPVKRDKAARDAALERPTIHLAPLWRHPLQHDRGLAEESGIPALLLPVGRDERAPDGVAQTLSLTELDDDFAAHIADLVAIPLDGGRPMSMTGYTVAVGDFEIASGALTLFGSGTAWLDGFLAEVRRICADTPDHLVNDLHFLGDGEALAPAAPAGVLLLEPQALEWRVCRYDCVIPPGCTEVHCPDSRKLAELIDQAMRKKEPVRPFPTVRGPAIAKSERVAA